MKNRIFAAFMLVLLLSCYRLELRDPFLEIEKTAAASKARGLQLPNPFEIDAAIKADLEKTVRAEDPPYIRLKKVLRYLHDNGFLNFEYDMSATLSAQDAFEKKRGNCLSHTGLFVALARHLDVPVYFVYVSEALDFEEKEGSYVVSSHIAAGFNESGRTTVVDFNAEKENFRLYEKIDDRSAFCLFYNNLAVDKMIAGDLAGAEKLLSFLIDIRPGLKELRSNLGVLYLRKGDYQYALRIFRELLEQFPSYQPALYNGLIAAQRGKNRESEALFRSALNELSERDPLLLYQKAAEMEEEGRNSEAIQYIRKAIGIQSRNAFLYATLARLYIVNGEEQRGRAAFQRAKSLAPNLALLKELQAKFPELTRP